MHLRATMMLAVAMAYAGAAFAGSPGAATSHSERPATDSARKEGSGLRALGSGNDLAYALAQQDLAEHVAAEMYAAVDKLALGRFDDRIFRAMQDLPRHHFVPEPIQPYAYLNRALPVGHGQTVSQPFVVAMMSQIAEVQPGDKVLLVSVGGGYHAALLHMLGADLRVVELLDPVASAARQRLAERGVEVPIRVGDGYYGWPDGGPFDVIIVRQALNHMPPPLVRQLRPGGRLIMPIGPPNETQDLVVARRAPDGSMRQRKIMPVIFTTLPGGDRI